VSTTLSKVRIFHHPDFPQPPGDVPYTEINQNLFFADVHVPYVEYQTAVDLAKSWLVIIQNYNYKVLSRTEDFGKLLDFSEILLPSKKIFELFILLNIENLNILSMRQLDTLINIIKNILTLYAHVVRYAAGKINPYEREDLIRRIDNESDFAIETIGPYIAYSQLYDSTANLNAEKVTETIKIYENERQIDQNEIKIIKKEINEILNQVKDVSALKGVTLESGNFSDMSDKYDINAEKWFCSSIIMGIITFLAAIVLSLSYKIPFIAPSNNIESAQLISGKIIILGILSYGLLTCIRNYAAQTHNAVVNRHRQNSLQTYRAFVDAASTNVTRDIVLTHAAAAVFSHLDTGYVKSQDTSGARSIIEMIPKTIMGDTKPG
jgi:hypothetical protein